jgi:hypothetical protein
MPEFGYGLGMESGISGMFLVVKHTILTNFPYSFWVWYDDWFVLIKIHVSG